ncbi:hypothetical protein IFM89_014744 [Coptis chinensis]|uniref:GDSL esterase/lipase n=1 Tax=Coptis chinensis TaxID=261450 RepID=A0A835IR63_9MAGN|nr:hypothetical protein IFM89_014744 [Coptis chinensis]
MSSSIRCSGPYMEAFSWFVLFLLQVRMLTFTLASAQVQLPAMFVFGDSLLDAGNNNDYITLAKANYPPNGIDFPYGATGRFCNGATIVDHLGYLLGLGVIPAFNDPSTQGPKILQGVNFASSGAGILNDTGNRAGQVLAMYQQVEAFGNMVLPEMRSLLLTSNEDATTNFDDYLAKSLFVSDIGNDDFLNHYFVHMANPLHKKKLYKFGARKFLVFGLGVLGCIPNIIRSYSQDSKQCFEEFNEISVKYNAKVKTMVLQLNQELSGVYILYWDIYTNMRQVLDNPSEYGFKYSHTGCCDCIVICLPGNLVCPDRSQYVFWDDFHPTDVANEILAKQAYKGTIQTTYPMNVKQLLQL